MSNIVAKSKKLYYAVYRIKMGVNTGVLGIHIKILNILHFDPVILI